MGLKLGPVLRLRDCDQSNELWRVSALVVTDGDEPDLTADIAGAALAAPKHAFPGKLGLKFWRFDLDVPLRASGQTVAYRVLGTNEEWSFEVPAKGAQPKFAYVSCNGFSSLKLMKSVDDKNALWKDIAKRHRAAATSRDRYQVLLMGGDQVYADAMWDMVPPLRAWNQLPWSVDDKPNPEKLKPAAPDLVAGLQEHFYKTMYCDRWSQPEVREVLARIPTIMMWDDHDIMDGWGSYPDEQLQSPVYRLIFQIAQECFELFQLQGTKDDRVFIRGACYSQLYDFGVLAILVPDLRSERTLDRVLSENSWKAIYATLDAIEGPRTKGGGCSQLMVMSSIPVMHARFGQVETILGWTPGQQEMEDDLHDHWSSRPHRAERLRLIHRLFAFVDAQGTRVTIVSGDVHVAAHASIVFARDGSDPYGDALVQLTSSAVVHPAPPAIMQFALNHLFSEDEEIDPTIMGHMEKMPGDERRYIAARNWLSLDPDDADNKQCRIWANWYVEGEKHPYTRVIHPVATPATQSAGNQP
jgi:hypothetical protein